MLKKVLTPKPIPLSFHRCQEVQKYGRIERYAVQQELFPHQEISHDQETLCVIRYQELFWLHGQ